MKMYFVARLDRKTSELGTFRGSDSHPGQSAILGARAEQVNRSTITREIRDYDIPRAMCEKLDLSQGGHVQIAVNYVQ